MLNCKTIQDRPEIHKVVFLELKGCKASRMPDHNNIIEAYLTILRLLGERIETLHNANTMLDNQQGVGQREHHSQKIALLTLQLASFNIHLFFPPCNHIHNGVYACTHHSVHMRCIYTQTHHKPT